VAGTGTRDEVEGAGGGVRVDRWLCSARMFKSRTQATDACSAGKVQRGEQALKASHVVRIGDRLVVDCPRGKLHLEVTALGEKRLSPQLARTLYLDHTPPEPPKEPSFERDRGAGRPTKRDRRELSALRGSRGED
jgi:ribosome-associated heat shock protein Hsp15